jgi:1-acyl-sn-glycerol-3-phosphate acyltransferase
MSTANPVLVKSNLLSWLITLPFVFFFSLTLLIFHPLLLIAHLFGNTCRNKVLLLMNQFLVLELKVIGGMRLNINFNASISPNIPVLIISNHQSMFDIAFMIVVFRTLSLHFVSKKELGRWLPSISFSLREMGSALIDRNDARQSVKAIADLAKNFALPKHGICIFPEGTRARDGVFKKFKMRGAKTIMSICPELQIVPITIVGSWRLLANNFLPFPINVPVTINIGKVINYRHGDNEDLILQEVENMIVENMIVENMTVKG